MVDSRLMALLKKKAKLKKLYPLSNFCKEVTNFKLAEQDFFRFDGFKETKYRFCDRKISDTFKIHILHSSAFQTRHVFDFLQVFAKSGGIGQKFKDYFFCYL